MLATARKQEKMSLIQHRGILLDKWPHNDFHGLMKAVQVLWEFRERCFTQQGEHRFILRVGGSETNQKIIRCLKRNEVFWANCWESHHRGDVYVFLLPS